MLDMVESGKVTLKEVQMFWYLKQLLPLTYRSVYGRDGKWYFGVWNMWFGRCFNYDEYEIVKK
jgi:hypothetical protein